LADEIGNRDAIGSTIDQIIESSLLPSTYRFGIPEKEACPIGIQDMLEQNSSIQLGRLNANSRQFGGCGSKNLVDVRAWW